MTEARTILAALCLVGLGCSGPGYSEPAGRGTRAETTDDGALTARALPTTTPGAEGAASTSSGQQSGDDSWSGRLAARQPDYNVALRTASLRLRGRLPSLAEMGLVANAPDPADAYGRLIDTYLEDPGFAGRMLDFWRDTFRMGGNPMLDTAPLFAAKLVLDDRPFTELFTARGGTCPTVDSDTGEVVPADCDNGVPQPAGVLTNPAIMAHFDSNLAFRRVRWVQETFLCEAFPAEHDEPVDIGGGSPYTSPWPFGSISGADNGGRIDFHDTASVVCANCHSTMNHIAPLFANFDAEGQWNDAPVVTLPLDGLPAAVRTDWLPEGEPTAWRHGVPVEDLPDLGAVLATDREVRSCLATRLWNWAFGRGDPVAMRSPVPGEITDPIVDGWRDSGMRMRAAVRLVFTSDDFVRF